MRVSKGLVMNGLEFSWDSRGSDDVSAVSTRLRAPNEALAVFGCLSLSLPQLPRNAAFQINQFSLHRQSVKVSAESVGALRHTSSRIEPVRRTAQCSPERGGILRKVKKASHRICEVVRNAGTAWKEADGQRIFVGGQRWVASLEPSCSQISHITPPNLPSNYIELSVQ